MTVTDVRKRPETLTMTITATFSASPQRVWQLWEDPRQLERWWGPPTWPATVDVHDLRPGGRVAYHMTGPDGDTAPRRLVVRDGFANADGSPNPDLPVTTMRVGIEDLGDGRTNMSIESVFPDAEAMERILAMGMEEGITAALGQIDAILAGDAVPRA